MLRRIRAAEILLTVPHPIHRVAETRTVPHPIPAEEVVETHTALIHLNSGNQASFYDE